VSPGDLEIQKKVGWVVSSTFAFPAIWGYSSAGYYKKYVLDIVLTNTEARATVVSSARIPVLLLQ